MQKAFKYMFLDNKIFNKIVLLPVIIFIAIFCSGFISPNFGLSYINEKIDNALKAKNDLIAMQLKGTVDINYDAITGIKIDFSTSDLILMLIIFMCFCVILGFLLTIVKSLLETKDSNYILPYMNLKKNFISGFKFVAASVIFMIPLVFIIEGVSYAPDFLTGIGYSRIAILPILRYLMLMIFIVFYLFMLFVDCAIPAYMLVYSKTNSIWSFYKFEEMFGIIRKSIKRYAFCTFMCILLWILHSKIQTFVLNQDYWIIGSVLLSFVFAYLLLVASYFVAEINKG